jgi:uncharacterized lipoprotein YbaY
VRQSAIVIVTVEIHASGDERPPSKAPVIVQVQDTSLADAPARVLGEGRGSVAARDGAALAEIDVDVSEPSPGMTVWAHVDVDHDGRVSKGDFITMQSNRVPDGTKPSLSVTVKKV